MGILDAPQRKSLSDSGKRLAERMTAEGAKDRARSTALAKATYDNTRSSQFVEQWNDLTAWTVTGGTSVQVSNNRLYSTAANPGCAYRPLAAPTGGTVRATGTYVHADGSGGVLIGMSKGTPGSGLYLQWGIYVQASDGIAYACAGNSSALTSTSTTKLITGKKYTFTITLDADFLSVVLHEPTSHSEWRAQFDRATATGLNNLCITNQHSKSLSGAYVGPLGVVQANSTVTPRAGIEDQGPTVTWTRLANPGYYGRKFGIRVALPNGYDPSAASSTGGYPVMFCFHNNGGNETFFGDNALNSPIAGKMLDAGFIVASVGYDETTSWGSRGTLDSYAAGYRYLRDNFAIGDIVFYANSMGGIEALLTLAEDQIPGVAAYAGTSPTANLAANYQVSAFTPVIDSSYGVAASAAFTGAVAAGSLTIPINSGAFKAGRKITIAPGTPVEEVVTVKSVSGASSPWTYTLVGPTQFLHASGETVSATYAQATAGHDPMLKPADAFRGVPMLLIHATDDTSVSKADNTDALAAKVAGYSDVKVVSATGGHSFPTMPNFADVIAGFYKRALRLG